MNMPKEALLNQLQTQGVRLANPEDIKMTRTGGAGPTDHKAFSFDGQTIMVPVHSQQASKSDFVLTGTRLEKDGIPLLDITSPATPKFYGLKTKDGIPYSHIATLHSHDVLATTVLQNCVRYEHESTTCKFCSIGESLKSGKTIAHKTPDQLAEVAKAAVELDNISQMIMTTGTPATSDRGAKVLWESVTAVKAAVNIPIQVQCEPPRDLSWLDRLKEAGADSLGMHLEAATERVRQQIMPSKSKVPIAEYMTAFEYAVSVFGRGNVSTYLLAGLGDTQAEILNLAAKLIEIGVYPFVVPFVPVQGTQLENHPTPSTEFMAGILSPLARLTVQANLDSEKGKAGCAKCGACSSLQSYEQKIRKNIDSSTH